MKKGIRFLRTIQLKLIVIYILLILFAVQLIGVYFMKTMETSFLTNFSNTLEADAKLLAFFVETNYPEGLDTTADARNPEAVGKGINTLNDHVANWSKINSNEQIQIIDANGIVVSASPQIASKIGQKTTQHIVTRALQNVTDKDNNRVLVDEENRRYKVTVEPITSGTKVMGVVHITKSLDSTYQTIKRINGIFFSGTIIALALTTVLGVILSHTITSPVKEITKQVTSVAEGRFNQRVRIYGEDEIGQLGSAFNLMTDRLKEALSSNEEEREKLSSILSNMSDGVMAADDRGRIILINHRACAMLGLKDTDLKDRKLGELMALPPEMERRNLPQDEVASLLELGSSEEDLRKVRVTFTPIHRRDIGTTGTIVVLQDVTEQEELEQSRREFVANVSHELRTPLTTIRSYLEALEDGALEDPELAGRFVGVARNETERMIRLVTDLLSLSRLDSRQATMQWEWTDVREMLDEVADRFAFQLEQRDISIQVQVDQGIPSACLDRDKIDQVLDNLVSNSIKYTADGGNIVLGAAMKDSRVLEVSVADNGIGIPKKDLGRIFERFYRVDKARSREMGGTGLGLSIAREIIKAHGGDIILESEYKKGTKVIFTLPYHQEGVAQA